jgi:hypothetical protein
MNGDFTKMGQEIPTEGAKHPAIQSNPILTKRDSIHSRVHVIANARGDKRSEANAK